MKCRHGNDCLACGRCQAGDHLIVYALEDGGISLEIISGDTDRELILVISDDGGRVYFAAKDGDMRRAGIVSEVIGFGCLIHWLNGTRFSGNGLTVGER